VQDATSRRVPFAVPRSPASRQSVLSAALVIVPSALMVHCWFVPPVHGSITTWAPSVAAVVPACMDVSPYTDSSCLLVLSHVWFPPALQSQRSSWVPAVVEKPGTSTQLPEAVPTISWPEEAAGWLLTGGTCPKP
jgi:hypothetical protein